MKHTLSASVWCAAATLIGIAIEVRAAVPADFNGDGYSDLAIGIPGSTSRQGEVLILYGSANGLTSAGSRVFHQGWNGLAGPAQSGAEFGSALAAGDFNKDGYADLAIGAPKRSLPNALNAGAVHIIYGSASGLTTAGNRMLTQDTGGIIGTAAAYDLFGSALATGDFDADGYCDLAIGVPGDDGAAGAVNVVYGAASGLNDHDNVKLSQDTFPGMVGKAEPQDRFGSSLTSGDFGRNNGKIRYADLAIGVPGEDRNSGAVNVVYGSPTGLSATQCAFFKQGSPLVVAGTAEANDKFGFALAAGDFGNNGGGSAYDDLAIGVPGEDASSGAVNIVYGSTNGLQGEGSWYVSRATLGIAGDPKSGDRFGEALAAGNLGIDHFADLAIGAPGGKHGILIHQTLQIVPDPGSVHVLFGGPLGLSAAASRLINGSISPLGVGNFGKSVAIANFGRQPTADLAVGIPSAEIEVGSESVRSGIVNIVYDSMLGIGAANVQMWHQGTLGLGGFPGHTDDLFGLSLQHTW